MAADYLQSNTRTVTSNGYNSITKCHNDTGRLYNGYTRQ